MAPLDLCTQWPGRDALDTVYKCVEFGLEISISSAPEVPRNCANPKNHLGAFIAFSNKSMNQIVFLFG